MRHMIIFVTLVFLAGCASKSNFVSGNRSVATTNPSQVKHIQRLGVLPLTGTKAPSIEAQNHLPGLVAALTTANPSVEIINLASPSGQAKISSPAHADHHAPHMRTIATTLNIDVTLSGQILTVHQQNGEFGLYPGNTRVTILYQLRDIKNDSLLWEKTIDGSRETMTTLQPAPSISSAIEDASHQVVKLLPALRTQTVVRLAPERAGNLPAPFPFVHSASVPGSKNTVPPFIQKYDSAQPVYRPKQSNTQ